MNVKFKLLTLALVGLCGTTAANAKTLPPQITQSTAQPERAPYVSPDQAGADFERAKAEAKKTGKLLLIDFGANWCPDCRMLGGMFQIPALKSWIDAHFVPVNVNVDHLDRNMDIAKSYGVNIKAIPTVLVVTPEGKLLNADATLKLGDARTMSPQAVADMLASWANRA